MLVGFASMLGSIYPGMKCFCLQKVPPFWVLSRVLPALCCMVAIPFPSTFFFVRVASVSPLGTPGVPLPRKKHVTNVASDLNFPEHGNFLRF